jgi:AcrR family transcriptional regulator
MLDAARELLLEGGARATTSEAIAEASGAPVGSIYHRFGSLENLVGRLWMRAVYRSQASFVAAAELPDATEAAVAAALSIFDFCLEHPADARLLASFGKRDLIGAAPNGPIAEELAMLNRPVERTVAAIAKRLYGTRSSSACNRVMLAVFDLPYGALHRHLVGGMKFPAGLRRDLEMAVTAVIKAPL